GRCVRLPLAQPGFRYDWERVRAAVNARTRLVLFNSPHNPACTTATGADLDALAQLIGDRDIVVLSDEVYEHVVFDGGRHISVLTHPGLASRSFAVFSFGKTLHATGLRVGYCVAPAPLTRELRKVHQFNTFSIAHPLQHAIATYLAEQPDCGRALAGFFQAKRDRLRRALAPSGFSLPPAQGTYFQLLDFSAFAPSDDLDFAERLLTQARVATIPLSPFYASPPALPFVRLCIAKRDSTLDEAAARLNAFAARLRLGTWRDCVFRCCSSRWCGRTRRPTARISRTCWRRSRAAPTWWCCRRPSPPGSACRWRPWGRRRAADRPAPGSRTWRRASMP